MLPPKLFPLVALFATALAVDPLLPANPQSFQGMALRASEAGYYLPQIDLKNGAPPPYGIYETNAANLREFLFKVPALRYLDERNENNFEETKENKVLPEPKLPLDVDGIAEDSIAIVDLRPDMDYYEGHIVGAIRLAMDDDKKEHKFVSAAMKLSFDYVPNLFRSNSHVRKAKYVVFYCNQGANRSPEMTKWYYAYRKWVFDNLQAGEETDLRRDQEVVLLGSGLDSFKADEEAWPLLYPRLYKSKIKPVPVDDMILHPSKILKIKKEPSRGEAHDDNLDIGERNSHAMRLPLGDTENSFSFDTARSDMISLDNIGDDMNTPRVNIKGVEPESDSKAKDANNDSGLGGTGQKGKKIAKRFRA